MPARKRLHETAALGGTFDVFHKGHEQLLTTAFKLSQKVIIGITSDHLVNTLGKTHPVEPYQARVRNVRRFLSKHRWSQRAEIRPLDDPFGPAATRKNLEALILTPDTLSSGRKLNRLRRVRGLTKLAIHVAPFVIAKDGKPISSTRVRKGEVNKQGGTIHTRLARQTR